MTKRTILLVEDEDDAREILARTLEQAGYLCASACTEADALVEGRRRGALDAAVADVRLGPDDRAGLRLIPALRSICGPLPVVVITAFADLDKVKQALNGGAARSRGTVSRCITNRSSMAAETVDAGVVPGPHRFRRREDEPAGTGA